MNRNIENMNEADITENLDPNCEPDCLHCEQLNEMIAKLKAELDGKVKELQAERQVCRKCFVVVQTLRKSLKKQYNMTTSLQKVP